MYLEDGELASDGTKRQRNFRWRNIDDAGSVDLFDGNKSEGEGDDIGIDLEVDVNKKIERMEREMFLRDQEVRIEVCYARVRNQSPEFSHVFSFG